MMLKKRETMSWKILRKDLGILGPNKGSQNWCLIVHSQVLFQESEEPGITETWFTYIPCLAQIFYVILRTM